MKRSSKTAVAFVLSASIMSSSLGAASALQTCDAIPAKASCTAPQSTSDTALLAYGTKSKEGPMTKNLRTWSGFVQGWARYIFPFVIFGFIIWEMERYNVIPRSDVNFDVYHYM